MSDLKMSDVFNLPVYQNESEFFKCVINMPDCKKAIGQMNSESWSAHVAHAINNHDHLVEEIAQLKADKAVLLEALEMSNDSFRDNLSKFQHKNERSMLDCFNANKKLLQKHKG